MRVFPGATQMSAPVTLAPARADRSNDLAPADVGTIGARAGRELALAVFPLSITDTGGWRCIPARKANRTAVPSDARDIQTSGAVRGAIRLVRERPWDRNRGCPVCVSARAGVFARALLTLDEDDDDGEDEAEDGNDAARRGTFGRETGEEREPRSDTHGRVLEPRGEPRRGDGDGSRERGFATRDGRNGGTERQRSARRRVTEDPAGGRRKETGTLAEGPDRSPREFECERF
ncbi:hypothetical protein DBV15_07827, partial [Temnothorax longispinosus]